MGYISFLFVFYHLKNGCILIVIKVKNNYFRGPFTTMINVHVLNKISRTAFLRLLFIYLNCRKVNLSMIQVFFNFIFSAMKDISVLFSVSVRVDVVFHRFKRPTHDLVLHFFFKANDASARIQTII